MKYCCYLFIIIVIGCIESPRKVRFEYGNEKYMVFDSIGHNFLTVDSNYNFKDILPDGTYYAFDTDTVYTLNQFDTNGSIKQQKYLRKTANYKHGKKHGTWREWMYLSWEDSVYLSSETTFKNGFYVKYVSFQPGTTDTFMINIYPDSAKRFGDWTVYKEYNEGKIYETDVIDSYNSLRKVKDFKGDLISVAKLSTSPDSVCRVLYDRFGCVINKEIYTYIPEFDSTLILIYDSTKTKTDFEK